MKLISLLLFCALAFGEEKGPLPLSFEDQEMLSRKVIDWQSAQLNTVKAKEAEAKAEQAVNIAIYELQKKSNALGCQIMGDKTWKCPSAAQAPPATP